VAIAEHAGGVHLGENSLPVSETKRLIAAASPGSNVENWFLAGVSCHSLEAAQSAAGADYIFFGPVFATPSKAAFGAPQGLEALAKVCRAVAIPVLAIGGITLENAASCLASGAAGIAAIRLFQDAVDLTQLVARLHQVRP
jgi:thiamine-phosphate pyrophosphorylase